MSNAFEQHARSNGGTVVHPGPPPDTNEITGDPSPKLHTAVQPAGRVTYDQGMPGAVSSPLFHITVNEDTDAILEGQPGRTDASASVRSVDITRYIDQNVGGTTGVRIVNGYTTGLNQSWNRHSFRGRAVQFEDMGRAQTRPGPVGRVNYGGNLAAGVASQFDVMPSLEDIYRSIAGRT